MRNSTPLGEWADKKFGRGIVNDHLQFLFNASAKSNEKTFLAFSAQDITLTRLEKLIEESRYIEYLTTGSSIVEFAVRHLIEDYIFTINSRLLLSDFKAPIIIESESKKRKDRTLGQLLDELRRYSLNRYLISNLDNFNSNRKKATHRVYDENIDINVVNQELKTYVSKNPILEIIRETRATKSALVSGLVGLLVDFGCIPKEVDPKYSSYKSTHEGLQK